MARIMTEQLEARRLMAAVDLIGGVLRIESTRPGERVNVALMQGSVTAVTTELDGTQRVLRLNVGRVDASYSDVKTIAVDADFSEVTVTRDETAVHAPDVSTAPVDVDMPEQSDPLSTVRVFTFEQQAEYAARGRELDAINAALHANDA